MHSSRSILPTALALLLLGGASAAHAQAEPDSCQDGRVAAVVVENQSIFPDDAVHEGRFGWAYRLANAFHMRTRERWIRRELLLSEGSCYDAFRVADSERILRRYNFISQAEVFAVRRTDGDWDLRVVTRDEWSTRVEVAAEVDNGFELRSVSVSEENLLGRGMHLSAFWQQRDAQRQAGVRFFTPRLLNSRADFGIAVGETLRGPFVDQELVVPFLGEVGRWAVRERYSNRSDFFQYSLGTRQGARFALLPLETEFAEVAVARRWGSPGDLLVAGIGLSRETIEFAELETGVEFVDETSDFDEGVPASTDLVEAIRPQTGYAAGTRINLLFAHRAIRFTQRTGLDALRGIQDLEVGSDVSLTLGRTLGATTSSGVPDDIYSRVRIYAAGAPTPFTILFDGVVEGRQIFSRHGFDGGGWADLFADMKLIAYWQPAALPSHTFFTRASAVGGWVVDQPFQLTLGGRAGVRGYDTDDFPGSTRVVFNVEDRIYLGWPTPDLFDLGITLFADAGRIWAGKVPFGMNSGWRGTVGGGLRIGFPEGSRGVVRLDLAFALDGDGFGSPILRISAGDLLGIHSGFRDPQLQRSRRAMIGPDRFGPIN